MTTPRCLAGLLALASVIVLSACGSNAESAVASDAPAEATVDDHDDEDHDDHDDHDDEDHGDEDHDDAAGGLGAHEHGAAELSVAWSGNDLVIDLVSPAINIIGFEYAPETDAEKAVLADKTGVLSSSGILVINNDAGCALSGDVDASLEVEGTHAEMNVSWVFVCDNPDDIGQLDATALFSAFPGIEDLDVQWVSPDGQSAAELSPSSTTLDFG